VKVPKPPECDHRDLQYLGYNPRTEMYEYLCLECTRIIRTDEKIEGLD